MEAWTSFISTRKRYPSHSPLENSVKQSKNSSYQHTQRNPYLSVGIDGVSCELGLFKLAGVYERAAKEAWDNIRRRSDKKASVEGIVRGALAIARNPTCCEGCYRPNRRLEKKKTHLSTPLQEIPINSDINQFKTMKSHVERGVFHIESVVKQKVYQAFDRVFMTRKSCFDSVRTHENELSGTFGKKIQGVQKLTLAEDTQWAMQTMNTAFKILHSRLDKLIYRRKVRGFYVLMDTLY